MSSWAMMAAATAQGVAGEERAITANRFTLSVPAVPQIGMFSELAGITTEVEAVDYVASAGSQGLQFQKLPGKGKPPTVTLKRGKTRNLAIWTWHDMVLKGNMKGARCDVVLEMWDAAGDKVAEYLLHEAWPSKLEVNGMRAGASEVLMESITIVCEEITRQPLS
ncbi:phage tail protein [Lentzea sp. E54]|uniref:phage tail protein n=1 Tax=Lentzea xerophila TaxID=3435883 RepID=UPI003DA5F1AF